MNVLFLFESVLPQSFHSTTMSPGELRVIAAQKNVQHVWALGRTGISFYDVPRKKTVKTFIEQKIEILRFRWGHSPFAYYFTWFALLWYGASLCKKHHIDVIHAESPHISGIAAVFLGKVFKIKVIIEYRVSYDNLLATRYGIFIGKFLSNVFWLVAGAIMRQADYIAANSRTYMNVLKLTLKLHTIGFYNPGVRVFDGYSRKTHGGVVVGFLGRLYPDKGPLFFLKMIVLGAEWFRKNSVRFIVGGDGPELSRLKQFVIVNKIDDICVFLGTVDRWNFFGNIDIYVNTTLIANALEMTIAEASSVGIPSIVFGADNVPETVKRNKSGIIVPVANISQLFTSVKLIVNDNNMYEQMSKFALVHAKQYRFENQVLCLEKIYKSITV